jgi:Flavinator of succinate dehydrogenase
MSVSMEEPISRCKSRMTSSLSRGNPAIWDSNSELCTLYQAAMFSSITRSISRRVSLGSCRGITTTSRRLYADPWPLPHTQQHLEATQTPPDEARIPPLPRPNESETSMRARLVYQSRKRGTLETDLLLSTFARENLSAMTVPEMREYDKVSFGGQH